ncbi:DUF3626 domain-containing protein [Micromonospora tulbaghiae]|uniref:DUF3626 domain-containing protein n=1 Tax=Micromonospora tulbaghiae TaxID=479978 RepID=UPI00344AFF86
MPVATLTDAQSARCATSATSRCATARRRSPSSPGVDAEFRGPDIPPPALRVAAEFARAGEPLHAALVGRAAASVVREPQRWADRGPAAVRLQHLWHVLVRFGVPA